MKLYRRAKRWKALPQGGGILDQEDKIMARLDLIAEMVEDYERTRNALEAQRAKNDAVLAQAGRGSRAIGWTRQ